MVTRAEKGPLRNANIVADADSIKIKQPAVLAQPDMIAHRLFPGKSDFNLRLDDHPLSNLRTEQP